MCDENGVRARERDDNFGAGEARGMLPLSDIGIGLDWTGLDSSGLLWSFS